MKRKAVSMILAVTMVATMAVGCGGSKTADTTAPADDAAAEETTEADAADAEDTADAAADAVDGDLSDKKVGVCIYQFSDNFMTLFRHHNIRCQFLRHLQCLHTVGCMADDGQSHALPVQLFHNNPDNIFFIVHQQNGISVVVHKIPLYTFLYI